MLRITFVNTLDHLDRPDWGNYRYLVEVNGRVIASGAVKDHYRDEGWEGLLLKALTERRAEL